MKTKNEICEAIQTNANYTGRGISANLDAKKLIHDIQQLRDPVPELKENQVLLLKEFQEMWSFNKELNLSCRTSAVLAVLENDTSCKVYGNDIDEVVQVFLSEEDTAN